MLAGLRKTLCAPPDLTTPRHPFIWWITFGTVSFCALFGLICVLWEPGDKSHPLAYMFLLVFLLSIHAIRLLSHKWLVFLSRAEDESYINQLLVTARTIEPTVGTKNKPIRPTDYDEKVNSINQEVNRIKSLKATQIVEWELLPLQNLLLHFMNVHVLISQARLKLDDLEDYASDTAYSIDREQFESLRHSVLNAIDKATDSIITSKSRTNDTGQQRSAFIDDAATELRASIQATQEYIIDYRWNWANGNVTLAGLKLACIISIPLLIFAGLLPIGILGTQETMAWFNWAFVGASGAITSVLLAFRHADETEVGHATSRREVSRAFIAAVLGFVSGTIFYAIVGSEVAGEILLDELLPDVTSANGDQKLLGVVWAFIAGFVFEKAIDTARSALQG